MATVLFSQALRSEIISNARGSFEPRLNKIQEAKPVHLGQKIYDIAFGQYKEHINALPQEWFFQRDRISVTLIDEFTKNKTTESFQIQAAPMPPRDVQNDLMKYIGYANQMEIKPHELWGDVLREYFDWHTKRALLLNEQKEYADAVDKIVHGTNSVNNALKVWPLLKSHLPQRIITKIEEPSMRAKRAAMDTSDIDLTKLTSVAVTNKLVR